MALQGTLDTFSLPDVLRLLATTAKTGRLRVEGDRGHGSVWMHDGSVVACDAEHALDGAPRDEVVFELLRMGSGSFEFETGDEPAEAGKPEDIEDILRRAGALLSEWHELEVVVPSHSHRVTLAEDLPSDEVTIDAEHWRSLVAVASAGSVSELATALDLSELGVSRVVRDLVDLGVADVVPPAAPGDGGVARRVEEPRSSRGRSEGGLLGRRASRREDTIPPTPRETTGETRAGWLTADTGSHTPVGSEPQAERQASNGRASLGGLRGRSSPVDPKTPPPGLTSRLGRSGDARPVDDDAREPQTGDSRPPAAPGRPTGGLTSRLRRGDRSPATPDGPTGRGPSPAPPATPQPPLPPNGADRNGLPRRAPASPPADRGRHTGSYEPPPLARRRPSDTGQIRGVASSALPADLHWAAEDLTVQATPSPGAGPGGPPRLGENEVAPHVGAMSPEARAAVEATVGRHGGVQGGPMPPAADLAQRGRLIDFLTSVRN